MKNFYKNKKVLIIGNTGFKGSWLSLWLYYLKAQVLGLSINYTTEPSNFKILNLNKKIKFKKTDIRNFKNLKKQIKQFKPDLIFHFAAEAIVKNSFQNPKKTWQTNTMGTVNILESIKDTKKKITAIIVTSDKVYKNLETTRGYKETDVLGGQDPYGASKAAADIATQSYFYSFLKDNKNIRLCIARAGNVIGGGDWSEGRIIPDCIKSWSKKKIVKIRNPNSTRPWQHVLDVLNGYLILAARLSKKKTLNGEAFNFGPKIEKKTRVIDIVKQMQRSWSKAKWKIIENKTFSENKLLYLDSKKAKKKLKWSCKFNFKKSINFTIDWYKEFYQNKKNIYEFSLNQIKRFEKY